MFDIVSALWYWIYYMLAIIIILHFGFLIHKEGGTLVFEMEDQYLMILYKCMSVSLFIVSCSVPSCPLTS